MESQSVKVRLRQTGPIPLDVEFDCHPGEILVLVGASGSGKSTTLRSIAGLYRPQSGYIRCRGTVWYDTERSIHVPVQRRAVGMVFQDYALFPHLTAANNIAIAINGVAPAARKAETTRLLERVHLQELAHRYPHELSGGQRQRVAMARALARKPAILLLDEPFSALDQQIRRTLVRELVQLRGSISAPIVHVTHNLNEARRIADRICILHAGRILQTGTPAEVMMQPRDVHTARLIGHDNLFSARIHTQDPDQNRTLIQWQGHVLETPYRREFRVQDQADWMIPSSQVYLLRASRPAADQHFNMLHARVVDYVELGEGVHLTVLPEHSSEVLHMNVSSHVARRDHLQPGAAIRVSLPAAYIHLMGR